MKVRYFTEKQLSYKGNQPNKTKETIRMFWFSEILSIDIKKYFLTLKYRKKKNRAINLLLFPQSTTANSNISSPSLSRKKTTKSNHQYSAEVRTEKKKREREEGNFDCHLSIWARLQI